MQTQNTPMIGFIGQGWIGKNYSDDFERRGYTVVRFAKEEPYIHNQAQIAECDIVFIAVPTPTTPLGFDSSIIRNVLKHVGKGKIAVIKSTILPEMTKSIQEDFSNIYVMHSPEFLSEATAAYDAAHPDRNIIGIPKNTPEYRERAEWVLSVLPHAPYNKICDSTSAELIKYGRNVLGYFRIMFTNILYDLAVTTSAEWDAIHEAMSADPDNGPKYMKPLHKTGRGAGGHCFIKDFAAFSRMHKDRVGDELSTSILDALEQKNLNLLLQSKKDLDLLEGVYGADILRSVTEMDVTTETIEKESIAEEIQAILNPLKKQGV
jgi:nucleotide sugar dehydrogenase